MGWSSYINHLSLLLVPPTTGPTRAELQGRNVFSRRAGTKRSLRVNPPTLRWNVPMECSLQRQATFHLGKVMPSIRKSCRPVGQRKYVQSGCGSFPLAHHTRTHRAYRSGGKGHGHGAAGIDRLASPTRKTGITSRP